MHYSRFAAASQLLAVGFVAAGPVRRDAPSTVQSAGGYSYLGCAAEPNVNGGSGRALTDNSTDTSDMTIEQCASYCGASNYKYFGVEYYSQCYCGNTLQPGTTIDADNSNCTMPCKGNANEYCGGDWHMNLYGLPSSGSGSTSGSSTTTSVAASTQVAATTPASSTTTTSTAPSATYPGTVQCPASDGTTFITGGQTYQIQCFVDHNGGDATNVASDSMDDCLVACSKYSGCTDVSWVPGSPGTCYIKTSLTPGNSNSAVWGAVLVGGTSSSASSTSKLVSSSAISSSVSSASSTSTVVVKPTVSSSAIASTSSTSSVIPSTSKTSSVAPSTFSSSSVATTSATTLKATTTASASTTSKASSTMSTSTTSTSAAATANPTFFSLSSCPSISVTRNAWLLPSTYKYTPYYTGSGYTENIINPANSILNPAQQYSIAGTNNACQAAQICLNNINSLIVPYLSIDLHYVSTSSSWQCTAFVGSSILGSYFNVPNSAVTKAYGFSGVLSSTSLFGW